MDKLINNDKRLRNSIGDGDYDRAYPEKVGMAVTGRGYGPSGIDAAIATRQPSTGANLTPRSDRLPIKPGPQRAKPASENTRELLNKLDDEDRQMNQDLAAAAPPDDLTMKKMLDTQTRLRHAIGSRGLARGARQVAQNPTEPMPPPTPEPMKPPQVPGTPHGVPRVPASRRA